MRAQDSDDCFRLGPARLTLRRLSDLHTGVRTGPTGTAIEGVSLLMSMTSEDAGAFKTLTAESVGRRLALVVDGRAWATPQVAQPITGGQLQIDLDKAPADELIALLTG